MITEKFVIIPVHYSIIVPIGIGSVNINRQGDMNFVIAGGQSYGRSLEERFRNGHIKSIQISGV